MSQLGRRLSQNAALITENGLVAGAMAIALVVASTFDVYPLPARLAIVAAGAFVLLRYARGQRLDRTTTLVAINYGYWLFTAVAVGLVPLTMFLELDFWRADGRILLCFLPLLFFLTSRFSPDQARLFLTLLLVICAAIACVSIAQYAAQGTLGLQHQLSKETPDGYWILKGLLQSHNATGFMFANLSLTWIILLWSARGRACLLPLPLLAVMTLIVFAAFILTISRQSYVGFAAASAYYGWLLSSRSDIKLGVFVRRHGVKIGGAFALILLLILPIALASDVIDRTLDTNADERNIDTRLDYWSGSLHLIQESPIVGIGYTRWNDLDRVNRGDWFLRGFEGIIASPTATPILNEQNTPHNAYLAIMTETGGIGLALFLLLLVSLFRALSSRDWLRPRLGVFGSALVDAAQCVFVFTVVSALFAHQFASPTKMLAFALFVGLAIAVLAWAERQPEAQAQ